MITIPRLPRSSFRHSVWLSSFPHPSLYNFANNPFSSSEDDHRRNVNTEDTNQLNLGSRESTARSLCRGESNGSRSCAQMQMFRPNQTDRQTHHEELHEVLFYRFLISDSRFARERKTTRQRRTPESFPLAL